jgi:hypothetical protein
MLRIEKPAQTHAEIVASIRTKIVELQQLGVVNGDGAELYQTQVLQLLTTIEQYRDKCETQADTFLQKYHYALGRREAFTMLRSMIESLLNASIRRAKDELEFEASIDDDRRVPEPVEPVVADAAEALKPITVAAPDVPAPTHGCVCGKTFTSGKALGGHKGRCAEYKESKAKSNGAAK